MENKTIMIIEDEAGIREMTQKYLSNEGYNVVTVESGKKALDNLQSINPHLILLDIEMPGKDGFTVCKEIRKQMTVPIIFLSVRRNKLDKVKCLDRKSVV